MKTKTNLLVYPFTIMVMFLMLTNSCKKDDNIPISLLPVLTTDTISDITTIAATCGGNITSKGGSDIVLRGVCWSKSPNPIVSDSNSSNDGAGIGSYTSEIIGLSPNTKYYVRAYAENDAGIAYGNTVSFTTETISLTPVLTIINPPKADMLVDKEDQILFNFNGYSNTNSQKELNTVKMVTSYSSGGTDIILDSTLPSACFSIMVQHAYTIRSDAPYGQVITITITLEDKDQKKTSMSFTLTVTNLSDINTYEGMLGAQEHPTLGSFYSTYLGQIFLTTEAQNNQNQIDFVFFFSPVGDGDCIAAPTSTELSSNTNLVAGWTTKNATLLKSVYIADTADYNKIKTAAAIIQKYNAGGGSGRNYIPSINDGAGGTQITYIAFKTYKGKYGIIKVSKIISAPQPTKNSVVLNVKVQR